ncbi:hypothetical protein HAU32_07905 [Weissella confusa]|uniref:Uncharacterized protein n=1 Tax=Weissella fermenti TaxID=2987699 RepID=A0ABT6D4Y0_9LACO|nr:MULTISPECIES: hypothetical protein [Weissella]MBJ7688895.1 hypothetical protein [Weissella confusa]MCW0926321.1 hypothetical protein [Weissella sp. LMG 11983]MDF9298742.1 hypothetical protein [Weissella sp. BK2]
MTVQRITGQIATIGIHTGRYALEIVPFGDGEHLMGLMTAEHYHDLFPAGDPDLTSQFEIEIEVDDETGQMSILSVFDLNADVIPAADVSEYNQMAEFDLQGEKLMNFNKRQKQRQALLDGIEKDNTAQEAIEEQLAEEASLTKQRIETYQKTSGLEVLFNDAEVASITNAESDGEQPGQDDAQSEDSESATEPTGFNLTVAARKVGEEE